MNRQDFERFAVQYWEQKVGVRIEEENIMTHVAYPCGVCRAFIDEISYLNLRSIQQLTNEELNSIAKIVIPYTGRYEFAKTDNGIHIKLPYIGTEYMYLPFKGLLITLKHPKWMKPQDEILTAKDNMKAIDLMRSIGILVPFAQYSVEQILEMGWAVVKK